MTDTDTLARHEAKTEPPKRWVNRWLVHDPLGGGTCKRCGAYVDLAPGSTFILPHCTTFPSREMAEQAAAIDGPFVSLLTYVGPEPAP